MSSADVVVAAGARTPFAAFGGALRDCSIPKLAARAASGALARSGVSPDEVDELVLGVNLPGSDRSLARQAQLAADIPDDRVSYTVDRACCSALTAISRGRQSLLIGTADVVVAGGAENLSKVPYFLHAARWGNRLGSIELVDQLVISCPYTHMPRAVQAASEAQEFGVSREDQDRWALRSQQLAGRAIENGLFDDEIIAVDGLERDESPRPTTTLKDLAALPTVHGSSTVTAGNAPGLSTGAACSVLLRADDAAQRGVRPLARILATAMVSGSPDKIASIPATAAQRALSLAGLRLSDVDLIEVNEAFAAVPLVTSLVLASRTSVDVDQLRERMNVNGGAVALGHPTGATGARLLLTLSLELRRRGGGIGVVTICGGIGEGEAIVVAVDGD